MIGPRRAAINDHNRFVSSIFVGIDHLPAMGA